MTTERDLDTRLLAARVVRDEDLPALPESFLEYLHASDGGADLDVWSDTDSASPRGPVPADAQVPASVVAAQQLVDDARQRRRRPGRKAVLRTGVAVVAIAAAWATAVAVAPTDPAQTRLPQTAAPTGEPGTVTGDPTPQTELPDGPIVVDGMTLVATERVTFPVSLDPVPEGLMPAFTRTGGPTPFGELPLVWSAEYRAADGSGFEFWIFPQDPREDWATEHEKPQDSYDHATIVETGTASVGDAEADLVRGTYDEPQCTYGPSTPVQTDKPAEVCTSSFAELIWQRPDGQWVALRGEDDYGATAAVVTVAESMVDRPQPVDLQIGLAPAGWTLTSYDPRGISFVDSVDPQRRLAVGLMERWRRETVKNAFAGMYDGPEQWLTVNDRPAKLVLVDQGGLREWFLAGEVNGALFWLQTPETFTQEQILQIARQVRYTP